MTTRSPTDSSENMAKLYRYLHNLLVIGLVLSTGILIFGSVINLVTAPPPVSSLVPIPDLIAGVVHLQGTAFITIGIILLIATPIFRVFGSLLFFVFQKDWKYAMATLVVLGIVLVIILVGEG